MPTLPSILAICAFVLSIGFAHAQECATGPAPTCGGTCQAGEVCVAGQSGTPCECVQGEPLAVTKLAIKLNFAKPDVDNVTLKGLIAVPDGFSADGRMVRIDVGGVARTFVLDAKGAAKSEGGAVKLAVKSSKGVVLAQDAKLAFKAKGNFQADLVDEGLTNATVDELPVQIRVEVTLDGKKKPKVQAQTYTAKAGKTGKTK